MSYRLLLKELRIRKGMTQQEVASAAGVPLSTYRSWEQGVAKKFSLEHAFVISAILGCTPNDLCGWYDDHPNEASAACETDAFERELLRDYRACSAQWKSTISMTARAAAGESREEAQRDTVPSQRLAANS